MPLTRRLSIVQAGLDTTRETLWYRSQLLDLRVEYYDDFNPGSGGIAVIRRGVSAFAERLAVPPLGVRADASPGLVSPLALSFPAVQIS